MSGVSGRPGAGPSLVLIGGGHSHVEVLRRFGRHPIAGVELTVISPDRYTPYSGMLPGYVAGHYSWSDAHIDLARLARSARARFIQDGAKGLALRSRTVHCESGLAIDWDRLSINVGSTPRPEAPGAAGHAVAVKPINRFNERWLALLERVRRAGGRLRIAVVGGGAGGVELLLAMQFRLRNECTALGQDADRLEFMLFSRGRHILPTHSPRVRLRFQRVLARRGIALYCNAAVTAVDESGLRTRDGQWHPADEVIWVTGAAGPDWLRGSGLALDSLGFIQIRESLQTITDPDVFAAGDIASMVRHPREKAGVIAVRQGPPLAANLRRSLTGRPVRAWHPQRHWLALISTGDRYAVASRGSLGIGGRWLWHCKDWIDRRFMRRYRLPGDRTGSGPGT
ncbi:FAD-dependent oxidoreductase [Spiribacter sp. 221]|uniref:FAD-dependent oxidoreductase n=1 Tax=Spiribacter onubensis TaxID=3122420 RepID=UPI00349FA85B